MTGTERIKLVCNLAAQLYPHMKLDPGEDRAEVAISETLRIVSIVIDTLAGADDAR